MTALQPGGKFLAEAALTSPRTECPLRTNSEVKRRPMNPLAPVTNTFAISRSYAKPKIDERRVCHFSHSAAEAQIGSVIDGLSRFPP